MKARAIFAWNLRRLRLERGISQERLAADAGIDRAYISELENKRGNATLDMLDKLVEVLDAPLGDFFIQPERGGKRLGALKSGRKNRT